MTDPDVSSLRRLEEREAELRTRVELLERLVLVLATAYIAEMDDEQ